MPKIIADARGRILASARCTLLQQGYTQLSLRAIARDCNIAVGTIYNYFNNKESLIASVMLEDWLEARKTMEQACESAQTVADGVAAVYTALDGFAGIYRQVWRQFLHAGGSTDVVAGRHGLLRGQIEACLAALLQRFGHSKDAALCPVLAELILSLVQQTDLGEADLRRLTNRLFGAAE